MSNVYYHGTIDKFVPSILKTGLTPHKDSNGWNATWADTFLALINHVDPFYNPQRDDEYGYVYLTREEDRAKLYAKSKADYFKVQPGEIFEFNGIQMLKGENSKVIENAKPALLAIDISNSLVAQLEQDKKDARTSYRFYGSIPPQRIHVV